jgi:catechol 2,3-dioxygenase-like lactoylglutathione lyase family enzyme
MSLFTGSVLSRFLGSLCLASLLFPYLGQAESVFTHAHMRVPDTAESAAWHAEFFDRDIGPGGPGPNIIFDNGTIGTMPNEGLAPPSDGGAIDHFGIAVPDVAAAVAKAREMGATVKTEPQKGVTAPVIAFIEDPWGVRMELLEDPEYLGINHIHMMSLDPDAMRDWFLQVFGGEYVEARGKGIFHTILYGNVWVHVSSPRQGGSVSPSKGRAIDHMGFRVPALDEFRVILKQSGYEPYLERANPPGSDLMFFVGPDGIHFEVAEYEQ